MVLSDEHFMKVPSSDGNSWFLVMSISCRFLQVMEIHGS